MSAGPIVTECPTCGTRFRVTDGQLQAAGGRVRCGACLAVFDAATHRVEELVPVASESEVDAQAAGAVSHGGGDAVGEAEHDDVAAAAGAAAHESGVAPAAEASQAVAERNDAGPEPEVGPADGAATPSPHGDGEAPRFRVLDPLAAADMPEPDPARRRRPVLDQSLEPGLDDAQRSQFDVLAAAIEQQTLLPERRRWRLPVIVLLGAVLVVAQALYLRAGEWSSNPDVRPVYDVLCGVLGCTVPTYYDPKAMRSTRVIVRLHPERADLLLVDAEIVNRAPYPQAFPQLRLTLLGRDGAVIGSRIFEPGDYRGGELATMAEVPPATPLQISVETYRPRGEVAQFVFELVPQRGED